MKLMLGKALLIPVLCLMTMLGTYGCAAVVASLPTILAYLNYSGIVLSQIESFVNLYFQLHPNITNQQKVAKTIADVKTALAGAQSLANGVDQLNQGQIDTAFTQLRNAYTDLVALCGTLGIGVVMQGTVMAKAKNGAGEDVLIVPVANVFAHAAKI